MMWRAVRSEGNVAVVWVAKAKGTVMVGMLVVGVGGVGCWLEVRLFGLLAC